MENYTNNKYQDIDNRDPDSVRKKIMELSLLGEDAFEVKKKEMPIGESKKTIYRIFRKKDDYYVGQGEVHACNQSDLDCIRVFLDINKNVY